MGRSLSLWARVAGLGALILLSGGCIYFTPPTGLCVTGDCRDFVTQREALANRPAAPVKQIHEVSDYKLSYVGIWGTISKQLLGPAGQPQLGADGQPVTEVVVDQTNASGLLTLRVTVGRPLAQDDGSVVTESMRILTVNKGYDTSRATDKGAASPAPNGTPGTLAPDSVKWKLQQATSGPRPAVSAQPGATQPSQTPVTSASGTPAPVATPLAIDDPSLATLAFITKVNVIDFFGAPPDTLELMSKLSGRPAYQVSMVGPAQNGGPMMRVIARAVRHRDRGYIVILTMPEAFFQESPDVYVGLFDDFELKDADPPYPDPVINLATPAPGSSPSAAPVAPGTAPTPVMTAASTNKP